jgi:glycine hydroxymethyltransferase
MHIIAAKAQCFIEANTPEFKEYCSKVKENANHMCDIFRENNIPILTGGTDSHLILIDLSTKNYSGREIADRLEENGITVNKNGIPNDPRSFVETSGIRIGTAAETTKGHGRNWFRELARKISNLINE